MNCLSVFDRSVGLVLKGLTREKKAQCLGAKKISEPWIKTRDQHFESFSESEEKTAALIFPLHNFPIFSSLKNNERYKQNYQSHAIMFAPFSLQYCSKI